MSSNQVLDASTALHPDTKPLTLTIIRSVTREASEDALLSTRVLRLDWLGLTSLDDTLDLFDGLRELYLQHNRLTDVNGLELLQNLELLTLGGNLLRTLDGLSGLAALRALDIRDNIIEAVPEGSLPLQLSICDLRGNPCASLPDHRTRLLAMLPDCVCLDGSDIEGTDEGLGLDETCDEASGSKEAEEGFAELHVANLESLNSATERKVPIFDVSSAVGDFQTRRDAVTRRFTERLAAETCLAEELAASALAHSDAQLAEATRRLTAARLAVEMHSVARSEESASTLAGLNRTAETLSSEVVVAPDGLAALRGT